MKVLFWIGVLALILGILSLVVPIPHSERQGLTVAGVSLGVETRTEEKIPPVMSLVMIAGGFAAIIAGKRGVSAG